MDRGMMARRKHGKDQPYGALMTPHAVLACVRPVTKAFTFSERPALKLRASTTGHLTPGLHGAVPVGLRGPVPRYTVQ